jgi:transcriptional regulator with XRE-family HTH domain
MSAADHIALEIIRAQAEEFTIPLGEKLRALRVQHDLSLRQLAEASGVRLDLLQRAEKGRWLVTGDQLDAILTVYA